MSADGSKAELEPQHGRAISVVSCTSAAGNKHKCLNPEERVPYTNVSYGDNDDRVADRDQTMQADHTRHFCYIKFSKGSKGYVQMSWRNLLLLGHAGAVYKY
jgi:hypothetical protein